MRIIRKVPELQENFITRAKNLLSDRNHGVLLTGITLITEMCQQNPDTLRLFRKASGNLSQFCINLAGALTMFVL